MKFARSGLAGLFAAAALLGGGAASAQAQTFTFVVCNHSGRTASVAVAAHASQSDKRWQAEGWWVVDAGKCSTIGDYAKGWFYYYAKSANGDWPGSTKDASKTCVRTAKFKRFDPEGYTCSSGETLAVFNGKYVDTDGKFTWTLDRKQ